MRLSEAALTTTLPAEATANASISPGRMATSHSPNPSSSSITGLSECLALSPYLAAVSPCVRSWRTAAAVSSLGR